MDRTRIPATAALVVVAAAAVIFCAGAGQTRTFAAGGLHITVAGKDSQYSETRAYQVVVSDELRTLSRLEVNRDGLVTDAWLTDLDRDGAFEIVVATGLLDEENRGAVDIHEWHGDRFESTTAGKLPPADSAGYRGNDQFRVSGGALWREFPLFETENAAVGAVPTGRLARFRYVPGESRWERMPP